MKRRREERKDENVNRGARLKTVDKKDGSQNSGGTRVEQKKKQTSSSAWPLEVFAERSTSEGTSSSSTGPDLTLKQPFEDNIVPLTNLGSLAML